MLVQKYRLTDKINIITALVFKLFGFDYIKYRKAVRLRQSKKRLAEAIREAENVHILQNGSKVYVFEETGRKGHYLVLTSWQAQKARDIGLFSSKSKHFNLDIEACHVIPGESMSKIKNKKLYMKPDFAVVVSLWLVGTIILLAFIAVIIKYV